ncbi:YraN family protein [Desulforhopalus sp. IMCC35007]|nr:YraN family protein [Desulforhopalus sp. IMCC35007]
MRQLLGQNGEADASSYLRKKGYKIITTNYRCKYGEIDIIAKNDEVLVFIEVKTRASKKFGSPAAAVDLRKQIQISKAAHHYLSELGNEEVDARFDVVSVLAEKDKKYKIEHIIDAFEFCLFK